MSYCKLNKAFVPEFYCLACEHCLPPAERVNGRMCKYDTYNGEEEIEEELTTIKDKKK